MKMRSFRYLGTLLLISTLFACNSSDDDDGDLPGCESTLEQPSLEEARTRLVGTWSNTDSKTMCTQTYTFSELAADAPPGPAPFNYTEAQEDISGLYGVLTPEDSTELRLVLQLLTDNLMPDCAQKSNDDSNVAFGARLTFPSADEISLTTATDPPVCKKFIRN